MELEPHQKQVVEEKRELDERLDKLKAIVASEPTEDVPQAERDRLALQCAAMQMYSAVLGERISAFSTPLVSPALQLLVQIAVLKRHDPGVNTSWRTLNVPLSLLKQIDEFFGLDKEQPEVRG